MRDERGTLRVRGSAAAARARPGGSDVWDAPKMMKIFDWVNVT